MLGINGAYKDAKALKKQMKEVQKIEKTRQLNQNKEKLINKSQLLA